MIAETVAITASNGDIGYIQSMTNISGAQLHFQRDVYNQVKWAPLIHRHFKAQTKGWLATSKPNEKSVSPSMYTDQNSMLQFLFMDYQSSDV